MAISDKDFSLRSLLLDTKKNIIVFFMRLRVNSYYGRRRYVIKIEGVDKLESNSIVSLPIVVSSKKKKSARGKKNNNNNNKPEHESECGAEQKSPPLPSGEKSEASLQSIDEILASLDGARDNNNSAAAAERTNAAAAVKRFSHHLMHKVRELNEPSDDGNNNHHHHHQY